MGRIFVTSDLHFGHDRGFLYEPRGFDNIEDHDEAVIANWNSVVNEDDDVYFTPIEIRDNGTYRFPPRSENLILSQLGEIRLFKDKDKNKDRRIINV